MKKGKSGHRSSGSTTRRGRGGAKDNRPRISRKDYYTRIGSEQAPCGGRTDMYECIDCGDPRRVSNTEMARRAQPRCISCGGRLKKVNENETQPSRETPDTIVRCKACGKGFTSTEALVNTHLAESKCLIDYRYDYCDWMIDNRWILNNTLFAFQTRDDPSEPDSWTVFGLAPDGKLLTLSTHSEEVEAQQELARLLVLVST